MTRPVILRSVALAAGLLLAAAATSANPIQDENAKPGTSSWQLTRPAMKQEIEGYASLTSVSRGGQIKLFVNTSDPQYDIDVYRMGWYGGLGGRHVLGPIRRTGTAQVIPVLDPASGLVECDWVDPYVLAIPDNPADPTEWASGFYLAKLTGSSTLKQSYIIFVVRDDRRPSDFLFQSSVTTYEAYNGWGGAGLYTHLCRQPRVSFNRPYNYAHDFPCGIKDSDATHNESGVGAGEFLSNEQPDVSTNPAGWEYNMVRFLEREGYDVTYCTDVDTHESAGLLESHRGFLSVGHDEYWSWEMRQHVEAARDAGVCLGFFSANTCYWQIRFEPSVATGDPDRTIVCYKSLADPYASDPQRSYLTTVQWRQAPVNRPEDSMIGVMYQFWGTHDLANSDIVIAEASSWVCAGTGLHDGDHLPPLVGYEADASWPTAPAGVHVVGHSPVPAGARSQDPAGPSFSDMVWYRAPSGAIVFATGTIKWSWGLDDYNALASVGPVLRTSRLSAAAQQITRNVLWRMNAPLASLSALETPTAWASPVVPRSERIASADTVALEPELLPGPTYFNVALHYTSSSALPNWSELLVLDGGTELPCDLPIAFSGSGFCKQINVGPLVVSGGRHSVKWSVDPDQKLPLTDDLSREWSGQWVWRPPQVAARHPSTLGPPPARGPFPEPNSNGLAYARAPGRAWVVSAAALDPAPGSAGDDYDLVCYDDYAGSTRGFSHRIGGSEARGGLTDFVVGHGQGTADTVYLGVTLHASAGGHPAAVDQADALGRRDSTGKPVWLAQELPARRLADVYEGYFRAGTAYHLLLRRDSGPSHLRLAVFPPAAGGVYGRLDPAGATSRRWAAAVEAETLTYVPAETGWHPVVAFRDSGATADSPVTYTLQWAPGADAGWTGTAWPAMAFRGAVPNPMLGSGRLLFTTAGAGRVRLAIYDVQGRRVRTLFDGAMNVGLHELAWDGRTDQGAPVTAGLYWAQLESGGRALAQKITLLR
ncbi:MAG TPA: N,N-dimethylformamidase beta subunit family domain-containing protein [Candidatus Saccharimonadales bacterium]|nr:N,N-dimethylformamidase beta subunit family domain-containing protein [Candidatus Saccharimonadales bacterium]